MQSEQLSAHIGLFYRTSLESSGSVTKVFWPTRLRALDQASLSACFHAIESSALGTLRRKHYYFCLVSKSEQILSVCPAFIPAVTSRDSGTRDAVKVTVYRRRNFQALLRSLGTTASKEAALSAAPVEAFKVAPFQTI